LLQQKVYLAYDTVQPQRDRYQRLLLYVYLPKSDGTTLFINQYLVAEGFARIYDKVKSRELKNFQQLEMQAKKEQKGLWRACILSNE